LKNILTKIIAYLENSVLTSFLFYFLSTVLQFNSQISQIEIRIFRSEFDIDINSAAFSNTLHRL